MRRSGRTSGRASADAVTSPVARAAAFAGAVGILLIGGAAAAFPQAENVPIANQVYEFLDRMAVRGFLDTYSNTMLPLSRERVGKLLGTIDSLGRGAGAAEGGLSEAERGYLEKFRREFMHEIDPAQEDHAGLLNGLFGSPGGEFAWDKVKFLYYEPDSTASLYFEFLGLLEYRLAEGDSYGSTNAAFETHGFRARGSLARTVGYFAQVTNGTLWGDREFALADPRLRSNVKFNDLESPYFDFAEAYLRADLPWFAAEFGREYMLAGTGYSGRLVLSDNAPAIDFLKLEARYKSVRYQFFHGSILKDSAYVPGVTVSEPEDASKYMAMHRLEISAFGWLNAAFSEMVIYQRYSPEFAYLNPLIFLKSAEHSLEDRDNTLLAFDVEVFPSPGVKVYGSLLVDDVDFSKLGTDWWGNQFGWQGGIYAAGLGGAADLDGVIEYSRLEPYLYTNRVAHNNYTSSNLGLGHRLEPNSDEWFARLSYRPHPSLRASLAGRFIRHGGNILADDSVLVNVGGDRLVGHREFDPETAVFLDGYRTDRASVEVVVNYEPVTDLIFTATYEYVRHALPGAVAVDHYGAVRALLEF